MRKQCVGKVTAYQVHLQHVSHHLRILLEKNGNPLFEYAYEWQ